MPVLFLSASLLAGCGSSNNPTKPDEETQKATAQATPPSATIARGATTTTTMVFSATGGLAIGSAFHINYPVPGITVTQSSTQTAGTTITKVYAIGADATVPAGSHAVRISTPVTGYTGTGTAPTAIATFTLTVTQ